MAASDKFCITVKGKGGHGAAPQGTVDAIVEAATVVTSLQTVISRNKVYILLQNEEIHVHFPFFCRTLWKVVSSPAASSEVALVTTSLPIMSKLSEHVVHLLRLHKS